MNGGNLPSDANGNHKDNHDEANNGDFNDFGEHDGDDHDHAFMDEDGLDMVCRFTNLIMFRRNYMQTLIRSFEFM